MPTSKSTVRFQQDLGQLRAVEVRRSSRRPVASALHRALFALGVVVTSYQVHATSGGLEERLELSLRDGSALDAELSQRVQSAVLPLALDDE